MTFPSSTVLKTAAVNQQLKMGNLLGAIQTMQKPTAAFTLPVKTTATPSVFTNTTVNQGATFGPINITPISAGASFSLIGGGSGAGGSPINISQVSQPTSNVSTQVSNVFTTTNTYPTTTTNQYTSNVSNVTNSPFGGSTVGATQTALQPTTVTPTVTPSQVATQTATPTTTTEQTAGLGGGMEWWQYLLIGGVAIVGIYMITKAFKGRKKKNG